MGDLPDGIITLSSQEQKSKENFEVARCNFKQVPVFLS